MWRKVLIGAVILFLIIVGYSMLTSNLQPRPTSWEETYSPYSKQPFGTKIFVDQLKNLFPNQKVERFSSRDYEGYFLQDDRLDSLSIDSILNLNPDSLVLWGTNNHEAYNLILFGNSIFASEHACNKLMNEVYKGSQVQLYAYNIPYPLLAKLGLSLNWMNSFIPDTLSNLEKVYTASDSFNIREVSLSRYIQQYPEKAEVVLKTEEDSIIGLKFSIGKGELTIVRRPSILSNNDLLYYDHDLLETLIGDLPQQTTYWSNNLNIEDEEKRSLLRLIYSYPTLKWAYFILLFSVIAYLLFNLQRRQQIVPIVEPPKNLSLAYLKTISDLYLSHRNYKSVILRKMKYTLAEIKKTYRLQRDKVDADFIEQLAFRSKISREELEDLFHYYNSIIENEVITKEEFKTMCKKFQLLKK